MVTQATSERLRSHKRTGSDLAAKGEPFVWIMGAALVTGLVMIVGFLAFIGYVGAITFWPQPIAIVKIADGKLIAGEAFRSEVFRPTSDQLSSETEDIKARVRENGGLAERTLYRVGNFDLFGEDFVWVPWYDVRSISFQKNFYLIERVEWGPFVGVPRKVVREGTVLENPTNAVLQDELVRATLRRDEIYEIERYRIAAINHRIEEIRLSIRRVELDYGRTSQQAKDAAATAQTELKALEKQYNILEQQVNALKAIDSEVQLTLEAVDGQSKSIPFSQVVRLYAANDLSVSGKLAVYFDRWSEFIVGSPREANTEGGVFPAIVGTLTMMILLSLAVAPFGVITALYLREYAKQGAIVSFIRISVNNLAGVPSIVYGVFGLGFFCYILGVSIDELFYAERLPSPTFGTGGVLWASLTLALLTVPVVIVATEEAIAAVPRSMREGSLACGATKWQTIWRIVLPRAAPGVLTGLILAMARGAGEVAPLMIVGVVKLAPDLPIDFTFPFFHFERSFMHLGFHIYDVGFQSRNSEAGRPMVFVTTLLLIGLVLLLNAFAIAMRSRLKVAYQGEKF